MSKPQITTFSDGSRGWHINDVRHRIDGPAVEWADGGREWYVNGVRHRTDGPTVERANGTREYWIHGVELNETLASFIENGLISLDDYVHAHAQ